MEAQEMSDEMTRFAIVALFGTLSVLVLGVLVPRFLSQRRMKREHREIENVYTQKVTVTVTEEVFDDDEVMPCGRPGSHRATRDLPLRTDTGLRDHLKIVRDDDEEDSE
ncbi:MAG TPA: hypothetical protein QF873_02990 [Patescibacteria group bacterium]|nr:hypothetical protein [Patescibacteria group bacterium]